MGLEAVQRLAQRQAVDEKISALDTDDELVELLRVEHYARDGGREVEDAVLLVVVLNREYFARVVVAAGRQIFLRKVNRVDVPVVRLNRLQALRFLVVGDENFNRVVGGRSEQNVLDDDRRAELDDPHFGLGNVDDLLVLEVVFAFPIVEGQN